MLSVNLIISKIEHIFILVYYFLFCKLAICCRDVFFMRALYIIDTLNNDVNLQAYYSLYKKERKKLNRQERKKGTLFFFFLYPSTFYSVLWLFKCTGEG